jgi:hypothetical protein
VVPTISGAGSHEPRPDQLLLFDVVLTARGLVDFCA